MTRLGAIQVHQMDDLRPGILPGFCLCGGIGAIDRFFGVIALKEADTVAAADIDCRNDFHLVFSSGVIFDTNFFSSSSPAL